MPIRTSEATWEGNLPQGKGKMKVGAGHYEGPFTFASRFESGQGTNPEELLAAAHAGCFSMALSNILAKAGHTPKRVHTSAKAHLEKQEAGFAITKVSLVTEGEVPGIDEKTFREHAEQAKAGCPVSKALGAIQIELEAKLIG
ncbi:MAG TPA: OsmC family protein [Polyangiaceae bacterium]|nr:OsmC family protein [Polyangiaceae bacterium]